MTTSDTGPDHGYAPPPPGYEPPSAPDAPRPPLRRTTGENRVVAGVAAGVARTLGIDPILVRVAFVVLTIFGGSGLVLYLAGWLFIPESGQPRSSGERFVRDNNALVVAAVVVFAVLLIGPLLLWRVWDGGFGFGGLVLLLLAVAAVIALTRRGSDERPGPGDPVAVPSAADGLGQISEETTATMDTLAFAGHDATTPSQTQVLPGATAPPPAPPSPYAAAVPPEPAPAPPKEKSVLGRLTIGVALLVAGTLVALDVADLVAVSAVVVIASALAVVALGLLLGTFVGRSRGLIALGIGLVLVLIPLSAVPDGIRWNAGDGAGDRTYRVATMADLESEYALGAGSLTLDLRRLDVAAATTIDASVGVGELIVLLPPDVTVQVSSDVGVGEIDLPATAVKSGVDIEQSWSGPPDAQPVSDPSLDLTLSAGIGSVTVIDPRMTMEPRELSR